MRPTKTAELVRAAREVDGILGEIAVYRKRIKELKARLPAAQSSGGRRSSESTRRTATGRS